MARALPARPNLEWLRKAAKQVLRALRAQRPETKLAEAQLSLAREFGFTSWRALKAHVDAANASESQGTLDDTLVAGFLRAARSGDVAAVHAALDTHPALVSATGPHPFWGGRPQALHMAIEGRQREVFDLLLERGADPHGDNAGYAHWSPLMLAIDGEQDGMRAALLAKGAEIGLVEALMLGDDALVERLLRPGRRALPRYSPNGGSILAFARTTFAIDRLLELGVSTEQQDQWETTPIEAMSRRGAAGQPLVRHMIARGLRAQPQEYARLGDRDTLEELIAAQPALVQDDDVLMGAVDFGHHELTSRLLELGASPNARASLGSRATALHSAAWNGDRRMVELLVDAGADIGALDAEHHNTPAGWARAAIEVTRRETCREVAEYLEGLEPAAARGKE